MASPIFKIKAAPSKGRIVYEYNPLFNFRYEKPNGIKDHDGANIEAMVPTDFDTSNEFLNFDLNHPVDITCQDSYDGSVNLIINDNKNIPRLINSRFSVHENNTYEVVDREGNNDTNLYDDAQFDNDTSLYKRVVKSPKIQLHDINNSGNLKVGNYVFYIKYVDADENETDIASESGLVSCFIGNNAMPKQINGGYKDQNSHKAVILKISNLDRQYDYIRIYYSRSSSDVDQNVYSGGVRILQKFPITTSISYITITGNEEHEDIPISELNQKYFIATTVKTQAQCQNRLYFGNVQQSTPDHKQLKQLSLRIYPEYSNTDKTQLIGNLDGTYVDYSTQAKYKYQYYNVFNIYNYVGYWPEEFYRFGIVYIMKDGTLSPVYNVLGVDELSTNISNDSDYAKGSSLFTNLNTSISVDEVTFRINDTNWNAKGVVKFPNFGEQDIGHNSVLSIKFTIPTVVFTELQKYAQGFFFVRQKRIPTILCQGMTLNMDKECNIPLLKDNKVESFLNSTTRKLINDYIPRLQESDGVDSNCSACICPDYEVRPSLYNQLFTGAEFQIKVIGKITETSTNQARLRSEVMVDDIKPYYLNGVGIAAVQDSSPAIVVNNAKFRGWLGEPDDPTKFRYIGHEDKRTEATNLVRGIFGPYLGFTKPVEAFSLVNIYIPDYNTSRYEQYRKERFEDNSEYLAISDRYSFSDNQQNFQLYRGDCFLCNFTHRLNRNFQDPSSPTNDIIVEPSTWKDNYRYNDAKKTMKVNAGDLNAVKLGTWLTLSVRSTRNLGLRATDLSYPSEQGMFGHPRGFYPLQSVSADGDSKIPESQTINGGFETSLGHRWNYTLPYMPAIKNVFQTRIAYSDIAIGDAFKNGYRVFNSVNYRDYTMNYGAIVKLIEFSSNLICVFEHGVALIPINERVEAGQGAGGTVFINTSNVLPENPKILSDKFGSQWPESIIKTSVYVYGIDTVGKKIWRTNGATFECLSDFTMQRFLNENISLGEFELTPIIGIRNVKSHYNAFKQDLMFTFYDYTKGLHEVAWNLCYNEFSNKFVTFYSWIPSYSDNIHNVYFSFDRDTSKLYSKLAASKTGNPEAYGITVDNVDLSTLTTTTLSLSGMDIPDYDQDIGQAKINYKYTLVEDNQGYHKAFSINGNQLTYNKNVKTFTEAIYLQICCEVSLNFNGKITPYGTYESTLYLIPKASVDFKQYSHNFWKHGQAGIFDIADKIKPCFWYGKQHPFEFEVVVADKPSMHKIFNNLRIMSNKVEPESFHYEIVGEVYDFHNDKKNIYYRQEATKCLYHLLGSNITYNWKYLEDINAMFDYKAKSERLATLLTSNPTSDEVIALKNTLNDMYLKYSSDVDIAKYLSQVRKSTLFPLTYLRQDKLDEINDTYIFARDIYDSWVTSTATKAGHSYEYKYLSGTEVVYDSLTNEFKISTHAKALNIKDPNFGRLRGNMDYKEDMWDIQINSIIFVEKNEPTWINNVPPIAIVGQLPCDITNTTITDEVTSLDGKVITAGTFTGTDISKYNTSCIQSSGWSNRKETKLRDKYLRVKVRYDGKNLALINSLMTLYTISYA